MWKYCYLLVLLTSTFVVLNASNLFQKGLSSRIVNGKLIKIEKAPWQVSVLQNGSHTCGGSIWSETIIITAAHCLADFKVSEFEVRAGSALRKSGGQLVKVTQFIVHEGFVNTITANDVAVIRLAKPLQLGPTVKPIPLAKTRPKVGANAYVSGWGAFHFFECGAVNELNGADLKIVDVKDCQKILNHTHDLICNFPIKSDNDACQFPTTVHKGMLCAGLDYNDSCNGDSGGPLVSGDVLVGVVSWGLLCGVDGTPAVYIDVAYFYEWLMNTINKLK